MTRTGVNAGEGVRDAGCSVVSWQRGVCVRERKSVIVILMFDSNRR